MKKSMLAITLVFATLACFAACRRLESDGVFDSSKAYVVDDQGVKRDVYVDEDNTGVGEENSATEKRSKDRGGNQKEYFYYNDQGEKVTVKAKDVKIEKIKARPGDKSGRKTDPAASKNGAGESVLSPEAQSFLEAYNDPEEIEKLIKEDVSIPKLKISEDPIPEENFHKIDDVPLGTDGKPDRPEIKDQYQAAKDGPITMDIVIKSKIQGEETTTPIYFVGDGKDNLYYRVFMPVGSKSMELNLIAKDGKSYIVVPDMKAYMEIPKEYMSEIMPEEDMMIDEDTKADYVSSGEVEYNGKKYVCDVYKSDDQTVKYYFADDELKRVETTMGEDSTIIEINAVEPVADKSKFELPKNYLDMTALIGADARLSDLA